MRHTILLAALVLVAATAAASAQPVSDAERKEGFVPLFNGQDFTGWRFSGGKKDAATPPKNWSVADGMIRLSGGGSPHLASEWEYADFDMRFRWRPKKQGYNSGFFVRSGRNVGANQINLAQKDAGHLMGGAKGGPAVPQLQKPPGEWNEWRVLAVGDKLTFWCNGEKAWEVTGFKPARGYLGLQAEGAAIDFKDLRIKELGFEPLPTPAGLLGQPLPLRDKAADYVLRLEYKGGGRLLLRGKQGELALDGEALGGASRPAGQWNYLEVRVAKDRATVWLNGTTLSNPVALGNGNAGSIRIEPGERGIAIRNARIKTTKE
jgi:hypothetical protein